MVTRWVGKSCLAFALFAAAPLATGCVDNNASAFVRQVQAMNTDDCTWPSDASATALAWGQVDPNLRSDYMAALLVGNQLVSRGDPDLLRPETDRIVFTEVEVHVFDLAGNELTSFVVPATGFADPGTGTSPGYGVVVAPVLDVTALAAGAGQTVVSEVIVFGKTLGNIDIETAPYQFSIRIGALGCVQPEQLDDPLKSVCLLGQDSAPDCRCFDVNGNYTC
ncbi:MAG: hypothetical protein IT373_22150 [Polyangiaceae bacterium]|nr:hypothetical protein [Polyangiaceae bacterium]